MAAISVISLIPDLSGLLPARRVPEPFQWFSVRIEAVETAGHLLGRPRSHLAEAGVNKTGTFLEPVL
jgi:hypothetical protein